MKQKIAIVASGGGMTCSYSVGSILALIDKYKLTNPDIVISGSGSAGTMAYFVAEQYASIRNIWENLLSTYKFLTPWRFWKVINIDYLIDEVFKKQDPLNVSKLKQSKINFMIPVTNAQTGEAEYVSNKGNNDIFETLRATKAMPIVYGKAVKIGNCNYCDSYLTSNVKIGIKKAKELGATKILALNSASQNIAIDYAYRFWLWTKGNNFRNNHKQEIDKLNQIEIDKNVFWLSPKSKLRISTLSNDKRLLKEAIDRGYSDVLENKELAAFINSF